MPQYHEINVMTFDEICFVGWKTNLMALITLSDLVNVMRFFFCKKGSWGLVLGFWHPQVISRHETDNVKISTTFEELYQCS